MSDELWLKELAQVKRDQEAESGNRLDERWDRLSAGTLSPEEEAELKALAETSEEAGEAYEAFRPLGPDFQASVVQAIRKQGLTPPAEPEAAKPPAKLLPFWRRASHPSQWAGWGAAAALAAAALFLLVRGPASYPPLPPYGLAPVGGDQEFRGGTEPATGVPVFSPGSVLTLDVSPEQAVTGLVEAQAFADRGAELVALELKPQGENGAVRLRGTLGKEIQLPPGDWKIWVVIGRPGKIPATRKLKAELDAGRTRHEDWQAVSKELRVEGRQASP